MAVRKYLYKCKKDRRKKSRVKRWTRQRRLKSNSFQSSFTVLPTKRTLTYAEAQKFVDVSFEGQILRLDINEAIELSSEYDEGFPKNFDSPQLDRIENNRNFLVEVSKITTISGNNFELPRHYVRSSSNKNDDLINDDNVDYEADEQDFKWLKLLNELRKLQRQPLLNLEVFELLMDKLEKKAYLVINLNVENKSYLEASRSSSLEEIVCCICRSEKSTSLTNSLLKCHSCNLTVHQDCYGVPYFFEGNWLCKKCLKSPNSPVKCCLCPFTQKSISAAGAFKQTDDGRWAHIICALFIPEITFGSNVYLEPVEKVSKVPEWRIDLKCEGCGKEGKGACLKCQAPGCSLAFHALCALKKNCYLKILSTPLPISTIRSSNTVFQTSKRTGDRRTRIFYCFNHFNLDNAIQEEFTSRREEEEMIRPNFSSSSVIELKNISYNGIKKGKKGRKKLINGNSLTLLNLPLPLPRLSRKCLNQISECLMIRDKSELMDRVYCYWSLKRKARYGLPLLQKIHQAMLVNQVKMINGHSVADGLKNSPYKFKKQLVDWLKICKRACNQLKELVSIVVKREKLKLESVRLKQESTSLLLQPKKELLRRTLNQLRSRDSSQWFAKPVSEQEAPGYSQMIDKPMDYSTVESMIEAGKCEDVLQLEELFNLIISNCKIFNGENSYLHQYATRQQVQCAVVFESAKRIFERSNFCPNTGMHLINKRDNTFLRNPHYATDGNNSEFYSMKEINDFISNFPKTKTIQKTFKENMKSFKGIRCFGEERKLLLEELDSCNKQLDFLNLTSSAAIQLKKLKKRITNIKLKLYHNKTKIRSHSQSTPLPNSSISLISSPSNKDKCNLDNSLSYNSPFHLTNYSYSDRVRNQENSISCEGSSSLVLSSSHISGSFDIAISSQNSFCVEEISREKLKMENLELEKNDNNLTKLNKNFRGCRSLKKHASTLQPSVSLDDTDNVISKNDLVWAKSLGYPWYPAIVIKNPQSFLHKSKDVEEDSEVPACIMNLKKFQGEEVYLVRFYDKKKNWQWLPKSKLMSLGKNIEMDKLLLGRTKQLRMRREIRRAYRAALNRKSFDFQKMNKNKIKINHLLNNNGKNKLEKNELEKEEKSEESDKQEDETVLYVNDSNKTLLYSSSTFIGNTDKEENSLKTIENINFHKNFEFEQNEKVSNDKVLEKSSNINLFFTPFANKITRSSFKNILKRKSFFDNTHANDVNIKSNHNDDLLCQDELSRSSLKTEELEDSPQISAFPLDGSQLTLVLSPEPNFKLDISNSNSVFINSVKKSNVGWDNENSLICSTPNDKKNLKKNEINQATSFNCIIKHQNNSSTQKFENSSNNPSISSFSIFSQTLSSPKTFYSSSSSSCITSSSTTLSYPSSTMSSPSSTSSASSFINSIPFSFSRPLLFCRP